MYYSTSRVLEMLDLLQAHGQMRAEDIGHPDEAGQQWLRRLPDLRLQAVEECGQL